MLQNNIACASETFEKLLSFSYLELAHSFFFPDTGESL